MHGREKILLALMLAPIAIAPALAGPNGSTVVNGNVTIQGQGTNAVTINQSSQNAIINWQTFNIDRGETVQILMPNSNSAELDRVIGNYGPSQINGNLSSNGRVFLVNPNGILFGQGAQVNVGSLLATTHDIANADFMAGRYNFNISGNPRASVVNQGTITAQTGGFAALVAPGVRNTGTITAWLGRVGLASANSFSLDLYGDRLIQLNVNDSIASQVIDVSTGKPLKSLVSNEGTLRASGGRVELSAAAARQVVDSVINNSGVIEANSIGSHNGMIVLSAATASSKPAGAPAQIIKIAGKLSAAGEDPGTTGGTVVISGENIALNGARIDASGANGGGTVLIGGDWGGGHPNKNLVSNQSAYLESYLVPNASNVTVDAATVINASATSNGNGGKVIVWSDMATAFYGTILARGGAQGGNGGFVETSGHDLTFTGAVDTSAANGKTGDWLLDPTDLTIGRSGANTISSNLATTNVLVFTDASGNTSGQGSTSPGSGNITFNSDAAIFWSSNNTLTIDAFNAITINAPLSGANGELVLNAGANISATAAVEVGTFNLQRGAWSQISPILPTFSATDFIISGGSFLRATGGDGSSGKPYQIADVYGLQGIGSSATLLSSDYILANNIDASGTKNWNSGAGFVPIGQFVEFTGVFDGSGHTISDLTINQPTSTSTFTGLFGVVGSSGVVENVGLLGGNVTGSFDVGALVGWNGGTVANSYATTAVTGGTAAFDVGGLVGFNQSGATITNSYASGNVNGNGSFSTGGLVGENAGTITVSYATGAVTNGGTFGFWVGGLVGSNDTGGSITQSYATGAVTGTGNGGIFFGAAGGLAGQNSGTISQSYATGAVTVDAFWTAGGLAGINGDLGSGALITDSYATGVVFSSGIDVNLGGLVGINLPGAVISNSQALGNVTSTANLQSNNGINCLLTSDCQFVDVGGFVGSNYGTITGTSWTTRPGSCAASSSFTCAGGNVSVGSLGQGGGFAGFNQGIINFAFAKGNVNGAPGLPSTKDLFNDTTTLGGFVGDNQGTISNSFATGTVGSAETAYLTVGGFAANNEGLITNSVATGPVLAGDFSAAGGFVGSNSPADFIAGCPLCFIGDGFNNSAAISNSQASGSVTVGASSIAGGFAANSGSSSGAGGSFDGVTASGTVTAGHDSIVGGLVGVIGENTTLSNSLAQNTLVRSTGANSIVGGVVGINVGTISNTESSAPVSGTSASYIGGIAGINVGVLTNVLTDPAITGSGDHDFIGGIAGLNVGLISDSTAQVTITSDPTSYVGGVVGLNGSYSNAPLTIPGSSFPNGTITNSSASGSGFSGPVGGTAPTFTPAPPAPLAGCTDPICTVLVNGSLGFNNPNSVPPDVIVPTQQISQISQIPSDTQNSTPPPILTSVDVNAATSGGAGSGTGGAGGGNGNGNGNNGSLASGKQGGNGAPPGVRLIDMPRMPLPPGSGLPPLNETRFLSDRLVLQFDATLSPQQIDELVRRYGLIIEAQQTIGILGRPVYTVRIGNGQSVRDVIQAIGGTGKVAPQPVYTYGLTQDGAALPDSANQDEVGDPAQYAVKKLELAAAHRISKGDNVIIAVIDSAVDADQPDFAGRVIDRYDAGCGVTAAPDAHGTGMTGAIASHVQLLGVAPSAKIIAICAFGGSGGTPEATSVKIIRGLDYAVQHGAKIVNMSFAGPYDPALAQALQVAREKGVLIVAAAGNAGAKSPPLYPGADPNVMAITATDENDRLFAGANQGKYVALAAPGVNILVPAPNGGVQMTTGTSVATANVSGVAALLLAEKPSRTPEEIRAIMVSTAKHLGTKGINPQFGSGLVDPVRALRDVTPVAGRRSAAAAPAGRVE